MSPSDRNGSRLYACLLALLLAACGTPAGTPAQSSSTAPPGTNASAPVVRRPLPEPTVTPPAKAAPPATALPAISVPPGLLYVCVTEANGERKQVGIEFAPKVHDLCSRHPEMGPCQYERQACRRNGGRVFAANGQEITLATESEYDKKVMRVRFRSN